MAYRLAGTLASGRVQISPQTPKAHFAANISFPTDIRHANILALQASGEVIQWDWKTLDSNRWGSGEIGKGGGKTAWYNIDNNIAFFDEDMGNRKNDFR